MNNALIAASFGCLIVVSGCNTFERDRDFDGRVYVGAGGLVSLLEPDTDEVATIDVDDERSGGGSVLIGYDLTNRFSLEANYSILGTATLSPQGEIDYSVGGLSALVYALSSREDRARREGFSVFGRAGVGMLDNSGHDVAFDQVNDVNLLLGLGVEYGLRNGLGLRGEFVAHDKDVKYGQLALIYRFGDSASRRRTPGTREPEVDLSGDAGSAARTTPVPTVTTGSPEPTDPDGDGVALAADDCPDTLPGQPVDSDGCDLFDGAVEGVGFESGSDTLTAGAKAVLDGVAESLGEYPVIRIAIEAHTDNTGAASSNLQLSRRRAIAVARYLVSQGVAGDRLKPRAFGESQPRVSNATAQGRTTNRRVELRVTQ